MDWQPIETAPKDGTPVLVYAEREGWTGTPRIVCAVYPKENYCRWMIYGCGPILASEQMLDQCTPTHWMPLPDPPNNRLTGAGGKRIETDMRRLVPV